MDGKIEPEHVVSPQPPDPTEQKGPTERELEAINNWEHVMSQLNIEEAQALVQDPFVVVDDTLYYAEDYGSTYRQDFNLCFYLCVEEGVGHHAALLKDLLAPLVKKLDDSPVYYGSVGVMANSDVLYTYVIEMKTPLCVFDEFTGKCQRISPKNIDEEEEEECIYLLRCGYDHFKRLYCIEEDSNEDEDEMDFT
jgi:hypothetical protein